MPDYNDMFKDDFESSDNNKKKKDVYYSPAVLELFKTASKRQKEGAVYMATGWFTDINQSVTKNEMLLKETDALAEALEHFKSKALELKDEIKDPEVKFSHKHFISIVDKMMNILNSRKDIIEKDREKNSYIAEFLRDVIRYSKQENLNVKKTKSLQEVIDKDNNYYKDLAVRHDKLLNDICHLYKNNGEGDEEKTN